MAYDFLRPILGDELYTQFCDKMAGATGINIVNIADGSYIPKGKFDDEHAKTKNLSQQITDLTGQLAAEKQRNGDTAELNAKIAQLTQDLASSDAKLAQQALTYRIKDSLRGMNVRNADIVMPLLNLGKITEQDGKLVGLTEQVDEIRKTDGYLFTGTPNGRGGFDGGQNGGGQNVNDSVNAAIRSMSGRG